MDVHNFKWHVMIFYTEGGEVKDDLMAWGSSPPHTPRHQDVYLKG